MPLCRTSGLALSFRGISASAAFSSQMTLPKFLQKQTMLLSENMIPALRITKKHRSACNKQIGALLRVSIGSSCYLLSIYLPLHQKRISDSSMQMKKSDSPDLDYGRAASALCLLPSHGSPHNGCLSATRPALKALSYAFLPAASKTCSSSQFRASRFIALSLQTIRREITCNYNSSLANILNCQDSSILRMCQHRSDILSAHTKHDGFGFIKFCKFTKS